MSMYLQNVVGSKIYKSDTIGWLMFVCLFFSGSYGKVLKPFPQKQTSSRMHRRTNKVLEHPGNTELD